MTAARPAIGATKGRVGAASPGGRPVIKEPVWTPEIPVYFYVGGLAGASAGFALLTGVRGEERLSRRAWAVALGGAFVSPALLISDLGRPGRFLNMLRMFKVTSPMSVGSWILATFGTCTSVGAIDRLALGGRLGAIGGAARAGAAASGLPLASYTAALLSTTAIPVWHHARHELPFAFTASAAMSAGAAAMALSPTDEAQPARRLAIGGAIAELAIMRIMERRLRRTGVGAPYEQGASGTLSRIAAGLTAGGCAIVVTVAGRSRPAAVAAGVTLTAGAVATRFAIFRAGFASARRPQDTIDPQRARIARGRSPGATRRRARTA